MPISKRQHKANASKGGKVGGPARAKSLTKKQRAAIARAGGLAKQAKWREQQALKALGDVRHG